MLNIENKSSNDSSVIPALASGMPAMRFGDSGMTLHAALCFRQ